MSDPYGGRTGPYGRTASATQDDADLQWRMGVQRRVSTIRQSYPTLASNPATLARLATLDVPEDQLYGAVHGLINRTSMAAEIHQVSGWGRDDQLKWWSSRTAQEQQLYGDFGYIAPQAHTGGGGLIGAVTGAAGGAIGAVAGAGGAAVGAVTHELGKGLAGVQHAYRAASEFTGIDAAEALQAANPLQAFDSGSGFRKLIRLNPLAGPLGLGDISQNRDDSVEAELIRRLHPEWSDADVQRERNRQNGFGAIWKASANGERYFSTESELKFLNKYGQDDPAAFNVARAIAAGDTQDTIAQRMSTTPGTAVDFQQASALVADYTRNPTFQTALTELKAGKISPGRDLARAMGLHPDADGFTGLHPGDWLDPRAGFFLGEIFNLATHPGSTVSGVLDAAFDWYADPLMLASKGAQGYRLATRASSTAPEINAVRLVGRADEGLDEAAHGLHAIDNVSEAQRLTQRGALTRAWRGNAQRAWDGADEWGRLNYSIHADQGAGMVRLDDGRWMKATEWEAAPEAARAAGGALHADITPAWATDQMTIRYPHLQRVSARLGDWHLTQEKAFAEGLSEHGGLRPGTFADDTLAFFVDANGGTAEFMAGASRPAGQQFLSLPQVSGKTRARWATKGLLNRTIRWGLDDGNYVERLLTESSSEIMASGATTVGAGWRLNPGKGLARMLNANTARLPEHLTSMSLNAEEYGQALIDMDRVVRYGDLFGVSRAEQSVYLRDFLTRLGREGSVNGIEGRRRVVQAYMSRLGDLMSGGDDVLRAKWDDITKKSGQMYAPHGIDEIQIGTDTIRAGLNPYTEQAGAIHLPKFKDVFNMSRQATYTRRVAGLTNAPFIERMMSGVWKPVMLLRPGFAVRASIDELAMYWARFGPQTWIRDLAAGAAALGDPRIMEDRLRTKVGMAAIHGASFGDLRPYLSTAGEGGRITLSKEAIDRLGATPFVSLRPFIATTDLINRSIVAGARRLGLGGYEEAIATRRAHAIAELHLSTPGEAGKALDVIAKRYAERSVKGVRALDSFAEFLRVQVSTFARQQIDRIPLLLDDDYRAAAYLVSTDPAHRRGFLEAISGVHNEAAWRDMGPVPKTMWATIQDATSGETRQVKLSQNMSKFREYPTTGGESLTAGDYAIPTFITRSYEHELSDPVVREAVSRVFHATLDDTSGIAARAWDANYEARLAALHRRVSALSNEEQAALHAARLRVADAEVMPAVAGQPFVADWIANSGSAEVQALAAELETVPFALRRFALNGRTPEVIPQAEFASRFSKEYFNLLSDPSHADAVAVMHRKYLTAEANGSRLVVNNVPDGWARVHVPMIDDAQIAEVTDRLGSLDELNLSPDAKVYLSNVMANRDALYATATHGLAVANADTLVPLARTATENQRVVDEVVAAINEAVPASAVTGWRDVPNTVQGVVKPAVPRRLVDGQHVWDVDQMHWHDGRWKPLTEATAGATREEALQNWAGHLTNKTLALFGNSRTGAVTTELGQWAETGRHISMDELNLIGSERLPTHVLGPTVTVHDPSLWNRVVTLGFDHVIGPMISSLVRQPLYMHAVAQGLKDARPFLATLYNTELRAAATAISKRLGVDDIELATAWRELNQEATDVGFRNMVRDAGHPVVPRDFATRSAEERSAGLAAKLGVEGTLTDDELATVAKWADHEDNVRRVASLAVMRRAIDDTVPFIDDPKVRTQFSEMLRNVAPFHYAEEQFVKRWARALVHSPEALRRGQLLLMAMKSSGIIYADPQSGALMYHMPGGGVLSDLIQSTPVSSIVLGGKDSLRLPFTVPFDGRVKYSIAGVDRIGAPSFGPVVAIPFKALSHFFPEMHAVETGLFGAQGSGRNLLDQMLPSYMVKSLRLMTVGRNESFRGQIEGQKIAAFQMLSAADAERTARGEDPLIPGADATLDQKNVFADRLENTAKLLFLTGIALQWLGPTSVKATDAEGQRFKSDYSDYLSAYGPEEGAAKFTADHPDRVAYTVFASETPGGARPSWHDGVDFMVDHEAWMRRYPLASPWLLPEAGNADPYDAKALGQATSMELRQKLSWDEWYGQYSVKTVAPLYKSEVGIYDDQIARLQAARESPTADKAAINSQLFAINEERSAFVQSFMSAHPAFAEQWTSGKRDEREAMLTQLRTALTDPEAPTIPHADQLRVVLTSLDRFLARRDMLSVSNSKRYVEARTRLDQGFLSWVDGYGNLNPQVSGFLAWLERHLGAAPYSVEREVTGGRTF